MKFRLFFKSFDNELIKLTSRQFYSTLENTNCQVKGMVALPTKIKKFCVLRSPHVDKDSREHFEIRLYKRFIDLQLDNPTVLNSLLQTSFPAGVFCSLKILE
jgi:small subunit ribosomal protein S10